MDSKQIPLTKGGFAIVDASDFDELNRFKWHLGSAGYAQRGTRTNGQFLIIRMHRVILKPPQGSVSDHINRDKLDNRRCNLRACSIAENARNAKLQKNNSSGITGVYWHKAAQAWEASITVHRKRINLGLFPTIDAARTARREAANLYHKEFTHQR